MHVNLSSPNTIQDIFDKDSEGIFYFDLSNVQFDVNFLNVHKLHWKKQSMLTERHYLILNGKVK